MSFRVPQQTIDTSDDDISFYSQDIQIMSNQQYDDKVLGENDLNISDRMDGLQIPQDHISQEPHQAEATNFSNIPPSIYQEICNQVTRQILSQLQNNPQINPPSQNTPSSHTLPTQPTIPMNCQKRSSEWPV